ncbi:carboxylesterase, partial [Rhypophila sp. PSN 637]
MKSRQIIANWIAGQPVSTTGGLVDGHLAPDATAVSEYLGIPYAEPPVGKLRFQPPVKYNGTSVLNATNFGYSCISVGSLRPANETWLQSLDATALGEAIAASGEETNVANLSTRQSEDCLTLNIWTKPQTGMSGKAVMIFIHDGGYYSGSSSLPTLNGQWLANDQDIVVVTFNYRLSIFGFPGNPLSAPNLGLLDTRLAIEWVRDNIAEFGGDPERITLFGQGTGGQMADLYSFAWTEDPIVQAYIPMSGTAVSNDLVSNSTAYANWFNTSSALGCGGARDNQTRVWNCMLTKNATAIAKAAAAPADAGFTALRKFLPTVDDTLVFGNYTDRVPVEAPILAGNTADEAEIYKLVTPGWSDSTWREYEALHFGCPAAWRAGVNVKNGNPTWRYRYFASWPNLQLFSGEGGSGAWHGSDAILLFNTTPTVFIPNTADELAFGEYYRSAWTTFAKDPFTGLSRFTAPLNSSAPWPQYSLSNRLSTIIRLGYQNQLGANL